MKFLICFLSSLFVMSSLQAESTITTRIHQLDLGQTMNDDVIVLLKGGEVARLDRKDAMLVDFLQDAELHDQWLRVTMDEKQKITAVKLTNPPPALENFEAVEVIQEYIPSVLESFESAKTIFKAARHNNKESQCFNRAHVWSYDWRLKHNLYSSKAWLYFTVKYIRENTAREFKWWFHVAPMVLVNIEGKIRERIMDRRYFNGPVSIQRWTNFFIDDKSICPVVTVYSDYADYPENGYCFLQKSSMYYYQPLDLELHERFGTPRNMWMEKEIKDSYLEAYDIQL